MLIQATGSYTLETEGQKAPLVVADGEFAEIPNGAAEDAIRQGAARKATMAEYLAATSGASNQQSSATDEDADAAPRRGNKRSNPAK